MMLTNVVKGAATVLLAVLVWCGVEVALAVRAWRALPDQVLMLASEQITTTQAIVDARLASLEDRADAQLTASRAEVLHRVDTLISRSDARVADTLAVADQRLAESLALVDTRTAEILRQTETTTSAATGVLESTNRLTTSLEPWLDCGTPEQGRECLQSKLWWMTLKADSVMTNIAIATPKLVEAAELSARSGQQAAASAAHTSANLAAITKPGPRWLRWAGVGLSVAAPASQVAMPFVLGRLK
ncbi:MAG: hypothetical protein KJZ84_18590 [Bryobacteraceae bacterium]|nr:hypothetical protein [Bryobacteraceae bacterium]